MQSWERAAVVPKAISTRTVILESFSGEKLSKRIFCSKTRGLELAGIALRVNFIMGRKQVKRTADFYPKFTIALFTFIISFNIELSSTFA